jgi:glycosyltransferase involved in cell wall biosynthesis
MNVANGYFLPLLKLRGVRTLVNVDGIEWHRAKWGRAAKKVFRLGARMTKLFGDRLVYDSHEIARRWSETFKRDGAFIPYGGESVPELPLEPGLTHRGYVLVVARFVPENTIPEFLEAAPDIAKSLPVVIVGSSGYGGELDARAESLSQEHAGLHWLGHISDDARLLSLWQHAAVYFHGHSVGGTNPTLVQAMATGTPIVARDTAYNREVLGTNGIFCEPDSKSITSQVLALAADSQAQVRASNDNLRRALEVYTWDAVCAAYTNEIEQLAAPIPERSRSWR